MITEDKVTKISCMADDFFNFFDTMVAKYKIVESTANANLLKVFAVFAFKILII